MANSLQNSKNDHNLLISLPQDKANLLIFSKGYLVIANLLFSPIPPFKALYVIISVSRGEWKCRNFSKLNNLPNGREFKLRLEIYET